IGKNLIAAVPEVAIQLVESANKSRQSHYMDLAYAALSFAVLDLEQPPEEALRSSENITGQIKDSSFRSVARAAAAIVAEYSSDELLRRCEQIEDTAQCLYLLERWAVSNPKHEDVFKISKYAI